MAGKRISIDQSRAIQERQKTVPGPDASQPDLFRAEFEPVP